MEMWETTIHFWVDDVTMSVYDYRTGLLSPHIYPAHDLRVALCTQITMLPNEWVLLTDIKLNSNVTFSTSVHPITRIIREFVTERIEEKRCLEESGGNIMIV